MKKYFPHLLIVVCVLWLFASWRSPKNARGFNAEGFGRFPVLVEGRIKPIETAARNALLIMRGKQTFRQGATGDGKEIKLTAVEWLMDVVMRPSVADDYKVFLITNPDVLGAAGLDSTQGKFFSLNQLKSKAVDLGEQARTISSVAPELRNPFQKELLKLTGNLLLYQRLRHSLHRDETTEFSRELGLYQGAIKPGIEAVQNRQAGQAHNEQDLKLISDFFNQYSFLAESAYLYPVPHAMDQQWQTIGSSLLATMKSGTLDPAVSFYAAIVDTYRKNDVPGFNNAVERYKNYLESNFGGFLSKVQSESVFNHLEPFYKAMVFYVLVFILALLSWMTWSGPLGRAAFYLLVLAFIVQTAGLGWRMYLQGRPPVTNLYSAAVFVGWGAALLGIFLERLFRNGIGSITAAVMGFLTLLVAHHLSGDGDTMEMLRAVLDTNLWLATHVVVVTLGYSATFLAGFLAILYIVRGVFTAALDPLTRKALGRMVYGVICFATLFSFVGTVLGGIWADQSWGRFWGWDPKENGALLIVMWNAIILHARWGGYIKERGLMVMAVFGNVVTSFSMFGVNMLGVGLHSYGFMDKAFFWLALFVVSQLVLMGLGMLPLRLWRAFIEPAPGKKRAEEEALAAV